VTLPDFTEETEEIIHDLRWDRIRLKAFNGNLMQHKSSVIFTQN